MEAKLHALSGLSTLPAPLSPLAATLSLSCLPPCRGAGWCWEEEGGCCLEEGMHPTASPVGPACLLIFLSTRNQYPAGLLGQTHTHTSLSFPCTILFVYHHQGFTCGLSPVIAMTLGINQTRTISTWASASLDTSPFFAPYLIPPDSTPSLPAFLPCNLPPLPQPPAPRPLSRTRAISKHYQTRKRGDAGGDKRER